MTIKGAHRILCYDRERDVSMVISAEPNIIVTKVTGRVSNLREFIKEQCELCGASERLDIDVVDDKGVGTESAFVCRISSGSDKVVANKYCAGRG